MSDELNDVIQGGQVQKCIGKALKTANEEVTLMKINAIFNSDFTSVDKDLLNLLCSLYYSFGRMAGEFTPGQMEKMIGILTDLRVEVVRSLQGQPAKLQQVNLPLG